MKGVGQSRRLGGENRCFPAAQNIPIKILWKQKFDSELEAIRREKQIKGWTREKKEKLIQGIWK
jgi:predicted GIY-YIG superfamily endonuclease